MTLAARFTTLAGSLHNRRWILFLAALALAGMAGVTVLQSSRWPARTVLALIGVAGLGFAWTWGGFLLSNWFGPNSSLSTAFKSTAAGFLTLWSLVGSIGFTLFTVSVLVAAGA
jgi:hypothetical protein